VPDLNIIIPKFRVHVAISQLHDEILVAPMSAWALSPYPEIDAGYAWSDFEPVSVIPFASLPEILGKLVLATTKICLFHYRAPEANALLEKREERRKYLVEKFGKDNPRFYHPPSFSYVASTAPDNVYFIKVYIHILVEDDGEANLRFIVSSSFEQSDLQPILSQFPHNSSDKELGQTILDLCNSK
jgi:hypothetical protein